MSQDVLGEALRDICGPLRDFASKLEGSDGATVWLPAFKKFLRRENPWSAWRTTSLGSEFKASQDFLQAFSRDGLFASDRAKDIMSKPDFAKSIAEANIAEEFDLVDYSTAELISENRNGTTDEVFAGAHGFGLEDLPAWVGPKLRYDYRNQPNGEYRFIGMKPILDSYGDPRVFCVRCRGGWLWLDTFCAHPSYVWFPGGRWLFRRPRKFFRFPHLLMGFLLL